MTNLRNEVPGVSKVIYFDHDNKRYRLYINLQGLIELHYMSDKIKRYIHCVFPCPHVQNTITRFVEEFKLSTDN